MERSPWSPWPSSWVYTVTSSEVPSQLAKTKGMS